MVHVGIDAYKEPDDSTDDKALENNFSNFASNVVFSLRNFFPLFVIWFLLLSIYLYQFSLRLLQS